VRTKREKERERERLLRWEMREREREKGFVKESDERLVMKGEIEYGRRRDAYGKETFFSFIVAAAMQLPTSPLPFFYSFFKLLITAIILKGKS